MGLIPSCHQATFVGAAVARQNPFDVSLRVGADYDQVCRIAKQTPCDIIMTDVMIAKVQGEGFSTANSGVAHRNYRDVIVRPRLKGYPEFKLLRDIRDKQAAESRIGGNRCSGITTR